MANTQSNPGFTLGLIPTPDQWNSAWTIKQDALITTIKTVANYVVTDTICKVIVDTSSGAKTVTVPPSFGQIGKENRVRVVKKSITPNTNQVVISDGTNIIAYIINENDGSGGGWLDIDADGTNITNICGVP